MSREIRSIADIRADVIRTTEINDYKDRLVKLIPSEIVTANVTIQGLLSGAPTQAGNKNLLL